MNVKSIFSRASKSFCERNDLHGLGQTNASVANTVRPKMNKTEAEFALHLEAMKRNGEILRYEYQGMTLRWFDMKYTPDFVVFQRILGGGYPELLKMIEVKGPHIHYRQQAMARFKGARGFWPEFTFEMWQKTKQGWKQIK